MGFVLSFRSDTELRKPFVEIRKAVLVDGSISLLLASVLALLLAIGVSRPIIRLVDMVKRIQSGNFPEAESKLPKRDEVSTLQNAIIDMGQSLKEKAELESYLAELADEVVSNDTLALHNPKDINLTQLSDETIIQDKAIHSDNPYRADNRAHDKDDAMLIEERFRLLSELGSGAMGKVYLAQDLALDEKIAIKVIQKSVFEKIEGFNFKEEIRLARKITHRNIVRTFDFGEWQDNIYISMEYVSGYDLGKLLRRKGPLDLQIGLTLCKQICSAMISAHQIGVIHRDLKPANMIITRQGVLKIMDFGLAMQIQNDALSQGDKEAESSQTGSYMMGTPRFMAPEQFSLHGEIDERTDIYSIGIIMYTIFNGRPPFSGKNLHDIANLHRNAALPPIENAKGTVPKALVSIIKKALAKEPSERFQSIKLLLEKLNSI
jgi:serine/threonine-protein kinase